MAYSYAQLKAALDPWDGFLQGTWQSAEDWQTSASDYWSAGNYEMALRDIIFSVDRLISLWFYASRLIGSEWNGYANIQSALTIAAYDELANGDGEVDMASIINAMLAASAEEIDYFIGIVDAYRVAIWDKPFNEEFYRALAEGFKQWG